jgi:heme oxygenase
MDAGCSKRMYNTHEGSVGPARESDTANTAVAGGVKRLQVALRQATRESHHVIDHHPLMAPLVRSDLTRQEYTRALVALDWLHAPLQCELATALAEFSGEFELADRVAWLHKDLIALGATASGPQPAWTPPRLDGSAELIGALYVIEGSTLGGQVIARRIEASLGLSATSGARFFNGWGAETEARWQRFWDFAGTRCTGEAGLALATATATSLFDALLRGLDLAHGWNES